jgi:hypothetical protein
VFKSFTRYIIAWCLASAFFAVGSVARADDSKEYLVKAAFIYNFVKFVEWPDGKAISKQNSIDICIIGDSGLSQTSSVFKAASTAKLSLSLVEEKNPHNAPSHCHIAFIGGSEESRLDEILAALKSQPLLTVSDIDGFAEHGGMIGFTTEDNKVKLVINPKAASATGIRIDAQLLEIAAKVIDK